MNFRDFKEMHNFIINLNGKDTKITTKNNLLFADSEVREGEIFISLY